MITIPPIRHFQKVPSLARQKVLHVLTILIRASLLFAGIASILDQQWLVLFLCALTFTLTFLPVLLSRRYHLELPLEFEIIIVLFIYASLFLGNARGYYVSYWWWDILLHTTSGIALGFVGFLILYVLYASKRFQANPFVVALFSFCFALALGTVWELVEFLIDATFQAHNVHMQKGLVDTMSDLLVDSLGALIASVTGYVYVKSKRPELLATAIERFRKKNPHFWKEH
ncbi:hypothetical protein HYW21_01580 [Candidatus Woesearchaeota archaeon]|nr:hypothetical protein [Candidatus Woesearchaeota archaeon]